MTDNNPKAAASTVSAKKPWVQPTIDMAPARKARAVIGPPTGVDYGIYS